MNLKEYSAGLILIFNIVCAQTVFSQLKSVVISPKIVTEPRKFDGVSENEKPLLVTYPIVKSKLNLPVKNKIESAIDYNSVFDNSLKAAIGGEVSTLEFHYEINYNKNYILDIVFLRETLGAYPWTSRKEIVFDLRTGSKIKAKDLFKESSLPLLTGKVRRKWRDEIARTKRKYGAIPQEMESTAYLTENLDDFTIVDKGVTFNYDYNFNFASRALQPKGRFFFRYSELKSFIKPDSLLAKLIR